MILSDELKSYRQIGNFEISNLCLQSHPCKHYVKNVETDKDFGLMTGDQIYLMLKEKGLNDFHFNYYIKQNDEKCIHSKNLKKETEEI